MKNYFLTGVTGVLGSFIASELLKSDHKVFSLIRASSKEHLIKRVYNFQRFFNLSDSQMKNFIPVVGDICLPCWGLSEKDKIKIFKKVHAVIHSAASINLSKPPETALKTTKYAVEQLFLMADQYGFDHNLKKIEVVSTVGVGGKTVTSLPEERIYDSRIFHNGYEYAKARTEEYLYSQIDEGKPITIHRPSMIIGDSLEGKIYSFQIFYQILKFLSGHLTFGILPDSLFKNLDVINVDYVANAIIQTSKDQETIGKIYHECSGPQNSPSLQDILKIYDNILSINNYDRIKKRTIQINYTWIERGISEIIKIMPHNISKQLKIVKIFLDYLNTDQSFECRNSDEYFEKNSILKSSPIGFLEKSIEYYLARNRF